MLGKPTTLGVLRQVDGLGDLGLRALPWVILLAAALLVLGLVVRYTRRRIKPGEVADREPWTFQQLREMHARGELADAEFELLRTRAIVDAADRQLWTLHDLREMHRRGELAAEEFELAKARLLAAVNPNAQSPEGLAPGPERSV